MPVILANAILVDPPATYLQPSGNKAPWKLEGETRLASACTLTILRGHPWLALSTPTTPGRPLSIALLAPPIVPLGTKATPDN